MARKVMQPKNMKEFKKAVTSLTMDGYLPLPKHYVGEEKKPSTWETMVSAVGYGGSSAGNNNGNFIAASSKEQPAIKGKGTANLGWMAWGADNKLPNNVASLTGMSPYTATGWKFNTDVTTGLGPCPKYRYTQYTPGIGIGTKEIDYEAAGPMIRQRIMDLSEKYLSLPAEDVGESILSLPTDINEDGDIRGELRKQLKEDIAQLKEDYAVWERTSAELKEFKANSDLNLLLLQMSSEFHLTGMCFPELQLSSNLDVNTENWRPKVTGLGLYSCWITRLERRDENNRINYVYLSNKWLEGKKADDKDITVLPALHPERPFKDLSEKLVDLRLKKNVSPKNRPTRYVLPVAYPSPGKAYYTQPSWHSIFGGSIYEYASTIIADRATRRKNSNIIGRIIYVHEEYLQNLFVQSEASTKEEKEAIFNEVVSEINAFLRDPENSGQSLFASTFMANDGKEHDSYRIVEIPASNKGTAEANKTELEEVCNILFFAQGIQPSLIGAVPGHSGSSGGTYQREMLLIKQLLLSPTQKLLLKPFETASLINGWDSHLVWRIQQMSLTTLDNSKTGLTEAKTE